MKCYYHKDYLGQEIETGENLFCNEEEKKLWGDKSYGNKSITGGHSIEFMQRRLKEMGKEEHMKGNYR